MTSNIDTIIAPASTIGGGVAVIRLSGPASGTVLQALTGRPFPQPRYAELAKLYKPGTDTLLDHGLALYFKAPNSFTGEDVVEIHCHGGKAVVESLLQAALAQPGRKRSERESHAFKRRFEAVCFPRFQGMVGAGIDDGEARHHRLRRRLSR